MINLDNINLENLHTELFNALEIEKVKQLENPSDPLEKIERRIALRESKLKFINEIKTLKPIFQKKFFEILINITKSNSEDFDKINLILTYGTLLSEVDNNLESLTDNETILLLLAMRYIPVYSYDMYGYVLSSKEVMGNLESKTANETEQINIIEEILNLLDAIAYMGMSQEDLTKAINSCKAVIDTYALKEIKAKQDYS